MSVVDPPITTSKIIKGESITNANTDYKKFDAAEHEEISLSNVIYPEKERELVRKLDWSFLSVLTLVHISCVVDGASVGNARIMGMSKDIKSIRYQFNIVSIPHQNILRYSWLS
jgi:hypothetical protein